MTRLFRQRFFWQFAGGFLLGAAGMVALQPGTAQAAVAAVGVHQVR